MSVEKVTTSKNTTHSKPLVDPSQQRSMSQVERRGRPKPRVSVLASETATSVSARKRNMTARIPIPMEAVSSGTYSGVDGL